MNWKQFLKPDLRKIVLFIILMTIGMYLTFTAYVRPPIDNPMNVLQPLFDLPSFIVVMMEIDIIPLNYLLSFIYWYLLSCLIVWVYDKYKKKTITPHSR
jgi:hypothetical protein